MTIGRVTGAAIVVAWCIAAAVFPVSTTATQATPTTEPLPAFRAMLDRYCVTCHNQRLQTAGLALDLALLENPSANPAIWERVITRLEAGSMPPVGRPRPDPAEALALATWLERELDRAWAARPDPGRSSAVHRLSRTQYNNAIRDLLALDVDVRSLLPGDETADGSFDNLADVLTISTAHLDRYLSVARQVTRLATGLPPEGPSVETFEIPLHVVQDDRQSEDLPFGSRGGLSVTHVFPATGEYVVTVRLRRQYQDYIMGMGWPQRLDVRLDGRLLQRFVVGGSAPGRPAAASYAGDGEPGFAGDPEWEKYMQVGGDAGLEVRMSAAAGPHTLGVSFVRELFEAEGLPQPLQRGRVLTNDQVYMDYASVGSVQLAGPYNAASAVEATPSRRAIFVCTSAGRPAGAEARACAEKNLSRLARLAYRRPVTERDVETLLSFFDRGVQDSGSFDVGVQFALERMLVDPDFLLRVHRAPQRPGLASYRLSNLEVASRLSFFLWSSIPDDRLIRLAERSQLTKPDVLEGEVRRMLRDPRALRGLVGDFASQWLNLRRISEVVVHPDFYPSFDASLLEAFEQETTLFLEASIREDLSVLDLLRADFTFVNERLARHYGLEGVTGSRFRRITLTNPAERGGLLAHGSVLATTSYPERTSPVLRGKWLLDNILGTPAPPPPPGVDTSLATAEPGREPVSIRERLARHRRDPGCASCHSVIDPLGFALENFDAIGGWRTSDMSGAPVDAVGTTLGGTKVEGLSGLRALLVARPEQFPRTVTEKLMAYGLGRRVDHMDRPSIRAIVRGAAGADYRWSALVVGVVKSPAFLMRAGDVRQAAVGTVSQKPRNTVSRPESGSAAPRE